MNFLGIYNSNANLDVSVVARKAVPFVLAIVVLVVLFLIFSMFAELLKPRAIDASFSENPLDMAKGNTFTTLSLAITNVLEKNASNVIVQVRALDAESIIVSPQNIELGLIEKGNNRNIDFIVRPNPAKRVLTGTYTLNITATMDGESYSRQAILEIKNQ